MKTNVSKVASNYDGVLVKFYMKKGTTESLKNVGVTDGTKLVSETYGGPMPLVKKGWKQENAFFKKEGDQVNIGLGNGEALEIFNQNIVKFEQIK